MVKKVVKAFLIQLFSPMIKEIEKSGYLNDLATRRTKKKGERPKRREV
jgi:hypothetical protein